MGVLSELEPKKVFEYFEKICSVPHGSGNTKAVSDMCAGFARELGLNYVQDNLNNLIIYKNASPGYENRETLILQGHMDMVCAKRPECPKDMAKEGLDLFVEGDDIGAKDTSLGGDDGIAVAMILALLADDTLRHPAIEAVFTVDEEVGMDGAAGLDMSLLHGRRMLNLDSEEEGVFTVSCAGGLRTDCIIPASPRKVEISAGSSMRLYKVTVSGPIGGHTGCEIDKGRGNANKLMSRLLFRAFDEISGIGLSSVSGGRFDNVICNHCEAVLVMGEESAWSMGKLVSEYDEMYRHEYISSDPGVRVSMEELKTGDTSVDIFMAEDAIRMISSVFMTPQGVIAMSSSMKGLVQTSSNVGMVHTFEEGLKFTCSVRSSLTSQKLAVRDRIKAVCESLGGEISSRGDYPGWEYREESPVRDNLSAIYEKQTGKSPVITAIHAGLECGLFASALNGLDCVSIGPDIRDIHSVDERLSISSVERLYRLVREFIESV